MSDVPILRRRMRHLAAIAAVGAVTLLTLAPRTIVGPMRGRFLQATQSVLEPWAAIYPGGTDQLFNTLLFLPLGATIALLLNRRAWPLAVVAGFLLSALVEGAQNVIPGRVPDVGDVLWNTCGAMLGVAVVAAVRAVSARQRGRRTRT